MAPKTIVIAEAGVNHNGDLELARELIDVAAFSGADYVKFQTFTADSLVTRIAEKANYQKALSNSTESQYDMLRKLELTEFMHRELIRHCVTRKIEFLSTGFDIPSLHLLSRLGQTCFKIPSGEITNLPYLREVAKMCDTVIMSTGMATLTEVAAAIQVLERAGVKRSSITVLHCTTEYPASMEDVNLLAMKTIATRLGVAVGYSDHTEGIAVPIAAVSMGAQIIEKHFTLDKALSGPDHKASLDPLELKSMIAAIRNIEIARGDGVKRPSLKELANRSSVRKSLVASKAIKKGELFTPENLTAKRPGSGISPMRWDEFIGTKSSRNYSRDELIQQ
jgi:N,N'-diacetyllegionaminate synthase